MILFDLFVLFLISFLGARLQGISLSILGGTGVLLLMMFSSCSPVDPPFNVVLCVASIVSAIGAVEAAGGLHYLVGLAESFMRKRPHRVLYLSPILTYLLTFLSGTNHIAYSILPIIAVVSKEVGIRPEYPLSLSVIAALHGTLASPISSIMVVLESLLSKHGIEIITILKLLIPATFGGLLTAIWVISFFSKKKPLTLKVLANKNDSDDMLSKESKPIHVVNFRHAKLSIGCFLLGSLCVILLGSIQCLRPFWEVNGVRQYLPRSTILPLVMLSTSALIMLLCRISPKLITQGKAFISGVQGMFSLLGISWLSSTIVEGNRTILLQWIAKYLSSPWQFSIILLLLSSIMCSSAATVKSILPLGIALGISAKVLLVTVVAVNGVFIIPIYPTMLTAISLDTTGTTRIGKYIFNHSFMLPGLISVFVAICFGFLLSHFLILG